jgi:hypothetical protein
MVPMDSTDNDYIDIISLLKEVESSVAEGTQPTYVDISETFNVTEEKESAGRYPGLLELLSSMESELAAKRRAYPGMQTMQPTAQQSAVPGQAARPQSGTQPQQGITSMLTANPKIEEYMKREKEATAKELSTLLSGVKRFQPKAPAAPEAAAKKGKTNAAIPNLQTPPRAPQQKGKYIKEGEAAAAHELSALLTAVKRLQPKAQPKASAAATTEISVKKKNDTVLLNLPITEQISELERIGAGLREQVFSAEQIRIIKEEADALEDARLHDEPKAADTEAESFRALRDMKLAYVLQLLKQG